MCWILSPRKGKLTSKPLAEEQSLVRANVHQSITPELKIQRKVEAIFQDIVMWLWG